MPRKLAVAALLLAAAVSARGQTRGAVDWIFLVDTSKSMLKNGVFAEVQRSLETFVGESAVGDSVAIFTFDRGVAFRTSTTVARDRADLLKIVADLTATGDRTHLGAAIAAGLARVTNDKDRTSAVVLFTDGKEDVKGIANPVPIPTDIQRALASNAHVFFISMGEHEQKLRDIPGARFLEANDAETIRRVGEEIRTVVTPDPPVVAVVPAVPAKTVAAPVPIPEPPLWRTAMPWAVALIALVVLALATKAFVKQRNLLEGELEIVKPRVATDAAYVGLPSLKSDEIALSSILPLDALAGSDARLFCRHKAGNKKVWIAATAGSLRVNDVEVPATELFDADTIQIGDAKLRFNRVGYDRPQEDFA
jgi:hypothetical protein